MLLPMAAHRQRTSYPKEANSERALIHIAATTHFFSHNHTCVSPFPIIPIYALGIMHEHILLRYFKVVNLFFKFFYYRLISVI